MTGKTKSKLSMKQYEEKVTELEELVKRTVADYRNLETRVQEEKQSMAQYANSELLKRLLPAFDTLFLAGKYTQDQGIVLTIKQLLDLLKSEGVERVEIDNATFNPALMDCIEVVEGEKDAIIEEITPGFIYNNKLLRAAKVKVGSGQTKEDTVN